MEDEDCTQCAANSGVKVRCLLKKVSPCLVGNGNTEGADNQENWILLKSRTVRYSLNRSIGKIYQH